MPNTEQREEYPVTHAVVAPIIDWHYRYFGSIAWDHGEIFIPTAILTMLITAPVWGPVAACEWVVTMVMRQ